MNLVDPSPSLSPNDGRSRSTTTDTITTNGRMRRITPSAQSDRSSLSSPRTRRGRKSRDPLIGTPGSEHGQSLGRCSSLEDSFSSTDVVFPMPTDCTSTRFASSSALEEEEVVVGAEEDEEDGRVEIFPGFHARLRGAQETWKSIEEGNYLPVTCLTCTLNLCCIMDADYVVCPCCQGITPVAENPTGRGGVGLGISGDDVNQRFHESLEGLSVDDDENNNDSNKPTPRGQVSLFDIFPKHVAEALRDGRKVEAEEKEEVTIFFSDIVGFTDISSTLDPRKIANLLDRLYHKFDELSHKHDCYKVETIGDAYMTVTNLVKDQPMDHVKRTAQFAMDAVVAANETLIDEEDPSKGCVQIRVGFHVGSVVADVVGNRNPRYCLFGDAVNTASRMESNSEQNRINCSELAANLLLAQWPEARLEDRGEILVKGKGLMRCFWVLF